MTDFEIHGRIYSFNNWLEEGRILPGSCPFLREKSRRGREYIINGVDIMCGIVGYVGEEQAAPILLGGLSKLEYRGYDSAGIAVRNDETGRTEIVKAKGTSEDPCGEDRRRNGCAGNLWYRTYQVGNSWRTF